ncbi:hypothetical protein KA005_59905, partial [bacterium]|nr:hypothetical protein [bacterium]
FLNTALLIGNDMKRKHKLLAILIAALIVFVFIAKKTHLVGRFVSSYVYDSKIHYVPCSKLPTVAEVERIVEEHRDVVDKIKQVYPGYIFFEFGPCGEKCPGKADIAISYSSHEDRVKIEKIINGKTFFGIPYSLHNI